MKARTNASQMAPNRPSGAINSELQRMDDLLQTLSGALSRLETDIDPVLSAAGPSSGGVCDAPASGGSLAAILNTLNSKIGYSLDRVNDLIARIDI